MILTRWPFRSEYLFSWDSANYALAMERIDIAAHRPHPPGYLGYVVMARGLEPFLKDANAALVAWNIIATALIVLLMLRIAWDIASRQERPQAFIAAATTLTLTSPLLWFYSDVAEIYPSELLGTLLIGICAWRAVHGQRRALLELALAVPLAATFKLTASVFMMPLAAYAWWRAASRDRLRAVVLFTSCGLAAAALFLFLAPGLIDIIWNQFVVSTSSSRVVASRVFDPLERFNRNARDTLTAGVSMLGVVNALALVVWVICDRRLPSGLDRRTALLWAGPWLFLCVLIHIGKPGYILPALPVAALILAGFYCRLNSRIGTVLIATQAILNIIQFAVLGPLPDFVTGGQQAYSAKTFSQRIASDLQALTFPTSALIRRTDEQQRNVLATIRRTCLSMDPVVVATVEPMDARRVMWYLPSATVVHTEDQSVRWVGTRGHFEEVRDTTPPVTTACPVVWLMTDDKVPALGLPPVARREPGVGFVIPAHLIRLAPGSIRFEQ